MNILILNWRDPKNPKSGGAEIVTHEHAKAWQRAGHNVTWFTSKFPSAKSIEILDGIKIVRRGNSISVYLLAPFFYLFSGKKFDLIIDEIHGLPFFTPLYVRVPKIAFIHEVASEIWDYMYPFPINKVGKFIEPIYFKFYKNIPFWVPCESTIKDLAKFGISQKNCTLIYCAISNDVLKLPLKNKEKIPTFIFVSRVVKMKGVEEVIKAFFHIVRELKDARLWIVGDGDKNYIDYLKKTMNLYAISTKINFLGRVPEKKKLELMRRAHILLHASVKEGWGLVVTEAASQGTPSVVYNVSGLRDSVRNNKTGTVLKKNTPEEMAKEAIFLLKMKARYSGYQREGLAWAKLLNWKSATKDSLMFIENVAKNDKKYSKN